MNVIIFVIGFVLLEISIIVAAILILKKINSIDEDLTCLVKIVEILVDTNKKNNELEEIRQRIYESICDIQNKTLEAYLAIADQHKELLKCWGKIEERYSDVYEQYIEIDKHLSDIYSALYTDLTEIYDHHEYSTDWYTNDKFPDFLFDEPNEEEKFEEDE